MRLDNITFSIVWDRLISTCNEQVAALLKTSFSPVVREAGDLASGLFDPEGRMLCQPITGTPGHINPLSAGVKNILAEIPHSTLKPGDVLITNDPWLTTGQLLDVTVLVPVFRGEKLIGHFACTCHMVDIGGYGPGVGASDVFEEGIQIPVMYLRRQGVMDASLEKLLQWNNRDPEHFLGDLNAMISSCYVGGSKVLALLEEYKLEDLREVGEEILTRSREAQKEAIRQIPNGVYRGGLTIDGFEEPIHLATTVTVDDGTVDIDFEGSSKESSRGINVVLNYTAGYATFAIRSATAPEIPNNDGCMEQIRVKAPKGTIVNCRRPAPTSGRHLVGQFITEAVFDALRAVVPDRVVAEGAGAISTVEVRAREKERQFTLFITISGGMGARPTKDGLSAVSFPACIAGVPVEIWETTIPVLIKRRELIPDSGGPGRYRGGLGQRVEFSVPFAERWMANIMTERTKFPARGFAGGGSGALGKVMLADGTILPTKGRVHFKREDVICLETAGGGGWGDPKDRDIEAIKADILEGYVSRAMAEAVYGVVFDRDGNLIEIARKGTIVL